ncbi:NTP transferase domain-containing protein [Candidatus Bathyarchaeota archaeon]|nr:NTP transferase domain-containing protein [Candidatus Bathyarchaeota archaeon]
MVDITRTGIILSGGQSSRLGHDKGLVELEDKPLICWVIDQLNSVTDEIIIVVGSDKMVPRYWNVVPDEVRVIPDCYPEDSPIIGLISGLKEARGEYAAVCACDMPFMDPRILELMFCISYGLNGTYIVKQNGWIESIPSVYHVSNCLEYAEILRKLGEMRIRKVLETFPDTVPIHLNKLEELDPDLNSFIDIDTADNLNDAKLMMKPRN